MRVPTANRQTSLGHTEERFPYVADGWACDLRNHALLRPHKIDPRLHSHRASSERCGIRQQAEDA